MPNCDKLEQAIDEFDKKNFAVAFRLFEDLAKDGVAVAQCHLATMYQCALGVEPDVTKAVNLYLAVAEKNITEDSLSGIAYNNLSIIYETGMPDLNPDEEKAKKYHAMAKKMGFSTPNKSSK